jgi:SET domain-containing protein
MLRVRTYLAPSPIDGIGLFADAFIPKDTLIWKFYPGFDLLVDLRELAEEDELVRECVLRYGYKLTFEYPIYVVCGDDARFMNHSSADPTANEDGWVTVAARDIARNEEITCDYGTFDQRYRHTGFVPGNR